MWLRLRELEERRSRYLDILPAELRSSPICEWTSRVDITEAYQVGGTAVKAAFEGKTGQMVILKRVSQDPYICTTDLYDVHKVANLEKKVPRSWITEEGDYVTAEMKNYIEPLIQAELTPIMITGQPRHIIIDDLPDIK